MTLLRQLPQNMSVDEPSVIVHDENFRWRTVFGRENFWTSFKKTVDFHDFFDHKEIILGI